MFGTLKYQLDRKRFVNDKEAEMELKMWLRPQTKGFCTAVFGALIR